MARLPYTTPAQLAELMRQTPFGEAVQPANIFRMLAHAPSVGIPALQLVYAILTQTELDPRLRELVILRVARRCEARYAWVQHAAIAASVGVSDTQIAALERGDLTADHFTARECTALAFADEVLDVPRVADDTFAWVREQFSPREVVELLLTVGYFRMMDRLVTALDLELEPAFGVQALDRARAVDSLA
jgi:alkylhydroperoxidase family enzyme